jgi:hypothetical protein
MRIMKSKKMRRAGNMARIWRLQTHIISIRKPKGKRLLGRYKHALVDNKNINLIEIR